MSSSSRKPPSPSSRSASDGARAPEAAPVPVRPPLTGFGIDDYDALADVPGARRFHARAIRRWTLARGVESFDAMTDLSKPLRQELAGRYRVRSSSIALANDSEDGTTKLLLRLDDDQTVESVLIPEGDRLTLCISSQVGCGVRCAFCASGVLGVVRNLTSGEIVEQFLWGRSLAEARGRKVTNVVMMGSGEPLNNFDNVRRALDVLNAEEGLGFGARRITVSTIGVPAKIDRLEELGKQINLAVSLHAPNEELRGRLIPGLDRVPLDDVLAATERYFQRTGREITFEYVLLAGENDAPEHARELAKRLGPVRGNVNLIPLNPVEGRPFERPSDDAVLRFRLELEAAGIRTTVRRSRGRDIDAACGQLRRRFPTGRSLLDASDRP